ncbi:MAG: hypothetical protein Kow00122_10030 [Thermoleophilia bacterium]|jgi:HSP20 family protein
MVLELLGADRMLGHVQTAFRPNADVYFDKVEGAIIVKVDLAGIDPDTINLQIDERVLRVSGHRIDRGQRDKVYQQMEIAYGPFERRFQLPVEVDADSAEARYVRGFLEIVLPVADRKVSRRIPISIRDDEAVGPGSEAEPALRPEREPDRDPHVTD